MDRIGVGQDVVREIFRNLVTAHGTRAVVDRDELLSAFPEKAVAEGVLRELIDARLVTSYEVEGREGEASHHRVEMVHECLLKAWPRLVWWQTQDEEGAVLRDQLKQAAHLWEERGRPADLLWSGTSFREYELWRERYPGALTALEEDFARSMAGMARKRRRLVRLAVAAAFALVTAIAIVIGISRQQAVRARDQARAEASHREAAQLLSLGRLRLADHPNAALAYAIASLERSDNDPARRFAVEALWQGPPALYLTDPVFPLGLQLSPDGRWMTLGSDDGFILVSRETGERRRISSSRDFPLGFTSDGQRLVTVESQGASELLNVWTLPERRLDRTLQHPGRAIAVLADDQILTFTRDSTAAQGERRVLHRLSLDGGTQQVLGRWESRGPTAWGLDASGTWIVSLQRGRLLQQRLDALSAPVRVLGEHQNAGLRLGPWRDRAVTGDSGGEVRIWNIPSARLERMLKSPADARSIALDPKAWFLATGPGGGMPPRSRYLFDLAAPPTAEPVPLLGGEYGYPNALEFSPDGSWLASVNVGNVTFWNMRCARSIVIGRQEPPFTILAFTRNGDLLSASDNGPLRRWPLSFAAGAGVQTLWSQPGAPIGFSVMEIDPAGRFAVLAVRRPGKVLVVPLDGSKPATYQVEGRPGAIVQPVNYRLDPGGRFLAVRILSIGHPELNAIRTLDLATGDERTFDTHPKGGERCEEAGSANEGVAVPVWLRDGRLVSDGDAGLRVWDLATGASRLLRPCRKSPPDAFSLLASPDSRLVLRLDPADQTGLTSSLSAFDLTSSATREITSHANRLWSFALDQSGMILVTGGLDGVVRVGPVTGEEPHLLFGHTGPVMSVAVSPDGHWIASGSDDGTIRLWPMPDLSKPPLRTLPHNELLAKLKSLTNVRAVRDPSSDTGWKIEFGPSPGWKDVPTW